MKYEVQPTTKFKKDLKLCKSRGYDIELINQIIKKLVVNNKLISAESKLDSYSEMKNSENQITVLM